MRSDNLYSSVNNFLLCSIITNAQEDASGSFLSGYSDYNLPEGSVYGGHWTRGRKRQQKAHSPLTHHRTSCSGSTTLAGAVCFLNLSVVPALLLGARFFVLPVPISLQCNPLFSHFLRDHNKLLLLLLVSGCLPLSSWFPQPAQGSGNRLMEVFPCALSMGKYISYWKPH